MSTLTQSFFFFTDGLDRLMLFNHTAEYKNYTGTAFTKIFFYACNSKRNGGEEDSVFKPA